MNNVIKVNFSKKQIGQAPGKVIMEFNDYISYLDRIRPYEIEMKKLDLQNPFDKKKHERLKNELLEIKDELVERYKK